MIRGRHVAGLFLLAALLLGATVTRPNPVLVTGRGLLFPDGTAAAPPIARSAQPGTGIQFEDSSIRFWGTGAIPLGRFVNGSTWSNDIAGIGLRLDEAGGANSILSMRANSASTIRYDNEQIEIVLGANNIANVAVVPIATGMTTGASFELRNAADTDGLRFEYLNNTTPLIWVTGSLAANRDLTVRPKNATSIPWVVQGVASQSANLQNWIDVNGVVLASLTAAGPAITAGSGTGVTVNQTAALSTAVYKVTVLSTNCIANATTCDLTIATLPAKTFLLRVFADLTTAYACTAVCTTATLSGTLGTSAGGTQLLASMDLDAATAQFGDLDAELGSSVNAAARAANGPSISMGWASTTTVTYRITSAVGNLGDGAATNLSQGTIVFYLETAVYP